MRTGKSGPPKGGDALLPPELAERYTLLRVLGEGGMGQVLLVRDGELDRKVALKLVRQHLSGTKAAQLRFRREARALARLSHPNIVRLFESGVVGDVAYFTMEHLEGQELGKWMGGQSLSVDEACRLAVDLSDALVTAHEAGVLHRDLKPANVLITPEGRPVLLDFGIARFLDSATLTALTKTREVVGTFVYLPPELFRGVEPSEATDVYQLCLLLYEMLAGHHPFRGEKFEAILSGASHLAIVPLVDINPSVPALLDKFVLEVLTAPPEDRPSAVQLLSRLRILARGDACETTVSNGLKPCSIVPEPTTDSPLRQSGPLEPVTQLRRPGAFVTTVIGLALLAAVVWGLLRPGGSPGWADQLAITPGAQSLVIRYNGPPELRYVLLEEANLRLVSRGSVTPSARAEGQRLPDLASMRSYVLRLDDGTASVERRFTTLAPRLLEPPSVWVTRGAIVVMFRSNLDAGVTLTVGVEKSSQRRTRSTTGRGALSLHLAKGRKGQKIPWSLMAGTTRLARGEAESEPERMSVGGWQMPPASAGTSRVRRQAQAVTVPLWMGTRFMVTDTAGVLACFRAKPRLSRLWAWESPVHRLLPLGERGMSGLCLDEEEGLLVALVRTRNSTEVKKRRHVLTVLDPVARERAWARRGAPSTGALPSWVLEGEDGWGRPLSAREWTLPLFGLTNTTASAIVHDGLYFLPFEEKDCLGLSCVDLRLRRLLWVKRWSYKDLNGAPLAPRPGEGATEKERSGPTGREGSERGRGEEGGAERRVPWRYSMWHIIDGIHLMGGRAYITVVGMSSRSSRLVDVVLASWPLGRGGGRLEANLRFLSCWDEQSLRVVPERATLWITGRRYLYRWRRGPGVLRVVDLTRQVAGTLKSYLTGGVERFGGRGLVLAYDAPPSGAGSGGQLSRLSPYLMRPTLFLRSFLIEAQRGGEIRTHTTPLALETNMAPRHRLIACGRWGERFVLVTTLSVVVLDPGAGRFASWQSAGRIRYASIGPDGMVALAMVGGRVGAMPAALVWALGTKTLTPGLEN